MIGGAALLIAAVGAATAGSAISPAGDASPTASRSVGGYVANLSSASLEGRDATQISRAGSRPTLKQGLSDKAKAQAARQISATASSTTRRRTPRSTPSELASDTWVLPTTGFHISIWFGEAGGYWSSGYHTGIDFATAYGTPVVAVANARWRRPAGTAPTATRSG